MIKHSIQLFVMSIMDTSCDKTTNFMGINEYKDEKTLNNFIFPQLEDINTVAMIISFLDLQSLSNFFITRNFSGKNIKKLAKNTKKNPLLDLYIITTFTSTKFTPSYRIIESFEESLLYKRCSHLFDMGKAEKLMLFLNGQKPIKSVTIYNMLGKPFTQTEEREFDLIDIEKKILSIFGHTKYCKNMYNRYVDKKRKHKLCVECVNSKLSCNACIDLNYKPQGWRIRAKSKTWAQFRRPSYDYYCRECINREEYNNGAFYDDSFY